MIPVVGKYTEAKVMIDEIESEALSQICHIVSSPVAKNSNIVIMPDTHAGKGCVIGFTQQLDKNDPRVVPNLVGVDIGCNISAVKLNLTKPVDYQSFDNFIRENIPLGAGDYLSGGFPRKYNNFINKNDQQLFEDATKLINEDGKDGYNMKVSIYNQLISVGSGNHFVELGIDSQGYYWITVHSGSRNFGLTVCNIYQRHAESYCEEKCEPDLKYLDKNSEYFDRYLTCVHACQRFSQINHAIILHILTEYLNKMYGDRSDVLDRVCTMHNYIDIDNMIVRKGAVKSIKGEKLLIPFNMRDGIALCVGKSNIEWNCSAPHGAGRLMSRAQAKKHLNLDQVKADMNLAGVFTTSLDYALDEAPDAYKDSEIIKQCIKPTADIIDLIKPVYNIKGK